jgi:hypothetical protein
LLTLQFFFTQLLLYLALGARALPLLYPNPNTQQGEAILIFN